MDQYHNLFSIRKCLSIKNSNGQNYFEKIKFILYNWFPSNLHSDSAGPWPMAPGLLSMYVTIQVLSGMKTERLKSDESKRNSHMTKRRVGWVSTPRQRTVSNNISDWIWNEYNLTTKTLLKFYQRCQLLIVQLLTNL